MLVEAQLTTGTDHTVELRKRRPLVGHGAEHERNNPGVERFRLTRKAIGATMRHRDRDGCLRRGALGTLAQIGLGLDGNDLVDRGWVMRKFAPLPAPTSTTRPCRPVSSLRRCSAPPRRSLTSATLA